MAKGGEARATVDAAILQHAVGADGHSIGKFDAALEDAIDVDRDIAAADQLAAHVDTRRIGEGDAALHQLHGNVSLVHALQLGKLQLAVDAFGLPGRIRMRGRHRHAFGNGQGDDVGQVVLALRVAVAQRRQPARQSGGRRDEDAGVDFADRALGIVGILLFDDAGHLAADPDDAAIAMWIVEVGRKQRQRAVARSGNQSP
jgi:hypothetical protein